jgi:hypothetical protein
MTAESRAASLTCWTEKVAVEPLSGGLTNRNFLVRHKGERYVVRIGDDNPVHLILRWHELAAAEFVILRVEGADSGNARGGATRAAGRVVTLAGRAGGRVPRMPHAPPQVLPHLTLGGRLSLHPDRTSCCGAVWGLCFGCELICRPKVLVVCDRWLEDSCTGSSP